MHTDYIYLFIYHVCMHLTNCVCVDLYTDCTAKKEVAFMNIFKNQI